MLDKMNISTNGFTLSVTSNTSISLKESIVFLKKFDPKGLPRGFGVGPASLTRYLRLKKRLRKEGYGRR